MSDSFNDILSQMLNAYRDGMSVDDIIAKQIEKESLNDEQAGSVLESVNYQDRLSKSYEDLKKAKADGDSREDWLGERLEERFSGLSAGQKDMALEAIQQTLLDSIKQTNESQGL